jgi:hypothetical protein
VIAGLDLVGVPIGIDSTVAGFSPRAFTFVYDPEDEDASDPDYRNGDVTNMFYWTNRFHDEMYLLGFTEQARNFQQDNFGRGGVGSDRVHAEGQDFESTNNARFTVGSDGGTGRMEMGLWPRDALPDRSSGLDRDLMVHELTHGLSNRLHANAMGLDSRMSRGLGEGWSDFYARALFATEDEDVNRIYTIGAWVSHRFISIATDNYYYGVRRFPYAVRTTVGGPQNRPHNPLTFQDIDSTKINLNDGAYPPGPYFGSTTVADEVHNLGEVWAMALFEVRARFITRLGFPIGNQRILQFVTDGMKLDPANPTFLQARDAILDAAIAGGGTAADLADIWAGFAARGMGVLASIQNAGDEFAFNATRVTEDFMVPSGLPTLSIRRRHRHRRRRRSHHGHVYRHTEQPLSEHAHRQLRDGGRDRTFRRRVVSRCGGHPGRGG